MLLVKPPDREMLLDVLRGLLESRYTREEVATWRQAVANGFRGDIPLAVEDGYWYFRSLSLLTIPVSLGDGENFFLREQDLEEYILDIEKVPCEEQHGAVRRIRTHQMDREQIRWPLMIYEDLLGRRPESFGLKSVRGIFEDREDLVEHTHLMFDGSLYLIVRQYDENVDQVMILGTSRDKDKFKAFVDELEFIM